MIYLKNALIVGAVTLSAVVALQGCGGGASTQMGAGSALSCTSSPGQNAFQKYGAAAFVQVNEQIITNVGNELATNGTTNLGTSFSRAGSGDVPATRDALATFKGKLAAFLVYTYGGPSSIQYTDGVTYSGLQDMMTQHEGLNITSSQYDYFVTNEVVPALTAKGVTTADVSSCFAPPLVDPAFKASIVGH